MNLEPWQREFDVALGIVREGAALARDIRRRLGARALQKADRSPVTVADFSVQALVAHRLGQAFPDDPLVAEEDSASLQLAAARPILQSVVDVLHRAVPDLPADQILVAIDRGRGMPGERFWTLDPVDGTQGFVRGDQYVLALALIVEGRVELALLGCPELTLGDGRQDPAGAIVYAVRNRGAFGGSLGNGGFAPLRVSTCRDPRLARVVRSVESGHIDLGVFTAVVQALGVEAAPTLMDSQAKHAAIAAGRADLLLMSPTRPDFHDRIWDQAAGTLLIQEAGGRVTDLRGDPLDFGSGRLLTRNEGVIASNGFLHGVVLDAVHGVMTKKS